MPHICIGCVNRRGKKSCVLGKAMIEQAEFFGACFGKAIDAEKAAEILANNK